MAKFCMNCGKPLDEAAKFCAGCGTAQAAQQPAPVQQAQPQTQPYIQPQQPPQYQQQYAPQYQPAPAPKPKSKTPFIVGGVGGALAIVLVVVLIATNVFGLFGKDGGDNPTNSKPTSGNSTNSGGDTPTGENAVWGNGELELYPAYASVPEGYAVYLDWNTSKPKQEIEWRSSDTAVASVDADGLIIALSEGNAVITASLKSKPDVKAYCGLYIVPYTEIEGKDLENNIIIWEEMPSCYMWTETPDGPEIILKDGKSGMNWDAGIEIPMDEDTGAIKQLSTSASTGDITLLPAANFSGGVTPLTAKNPRRKVIIVKEGVRKSLKIGYDWSIKIDGETTGRFDGYGGWFCDHRIVFSMQAVKKGGTTPIGAYLGKAFLRDDEYDYNPAGIGFITEDTRSRVGDLSFGRQDSVYNTELHATLLLNDGLFAITPAHQTYELSEKGKLWRMTHPKNAPGYVDETYTPSNPRPEDLGYEVLDLSMAWDCFQICDSKTTNKDTGKVTTSHDELLIEGLAMWITIRIAYNVVEVEFHTCTKLGQVIIGGGTLTKRLTVTSY